MSYWMTSGSHRLKVKQSTKSQNNSVVSVWNAYSNDKFQSFTAQTKSTQSRRKRVNGEFEK